MKTHEYWETCAGLLRSCCYKWQQPQNDTNFPIASLLPTLLHFIVVQQNLPLYALWPKNNINDDIMGLCATENKCIYKKQKQLTNTRSTIVQRNQKPSLSLGCDLYQHMKTQCARLLAQDNKTKTSRLERASESANSGFWANSGF